MKRRWRTAVLLLLAVFFTLGAYWWHASSKPLRPQFDVPSAGRVDDVAVINPPSSTPLEVEFAGAPLAMAPTKFDLKRAMAGATDWYALMHELTKHPEVGGLFYANLVRRRCMTFRDYRGSTASATSAAQDAAYRRGETLCSGFQDYELEPSQYKSLRSSTNARLDPLLSLSSQLLEATSEVDQARAVANALSTRDPALLSSPLTNISSGGVFFDGTSYGSGTGHQVYFAASQMLGCQLGDTCDDSDFSVTLACAIEGICATSRADLLQRRMLESDPSGKAWDEAVALKSKMLDAVNRRDARPFLLAPAGEVTKAQTVAR